MFRNSIAFALFVALPAAACAPSTDRVDDDLSAAYERGNGEESKADSSGTFDYFLITRDFRKCAFPMCGGYYVSRANFEETKCADGRYAPTCYVAELDLSPANLPAGHGFLGAIEAGKGLTRGKLDKKRFPNGGQFGRFTASEAWVAGTESGSTEGVFVKLEQLGIRCAAAPCADKLESKLNSTLTARIAELDFEPSGANEDEIAKAYDALLGNNLIITGDRYTVQGPGGTAKARTVNQFYLRMAEGERVIEAEDASQVSRRGAWAVFSGEVLHNGQGLEASAAGATLTFSFEGTGLTVFHETGPNRRTFSVKIDGTNYGTVDTNAPDFSFQVPTVIATGLAAGRHNVTLRCTAPICAVDYFSIAH